MLKCAVKVVGAHYLIVTIDVTAFRHVLVHVLNYDGV